MTHQTHLTTEDRNDFDRFLIEYGFSRELVQAITENTADQIPMPEGFNSIQLQSSEIQGIGMFAQSDLERGALLAPARIGGMRTPAGRYTNHSPRPSAVFKSLPNGDILMMAKTHIEAGDEITIDYRQAGAVNGNRLPCSKPEMLKTLQPRFFDLQLPAKTIDDLERFLEDAIETIGYLPSIPDMIAMA